MPSNNTATIGPKDSNTSTTPFYLRNGMNTSTAHNISLREMLPLIMRSSRAAAGLEEEIDRPHLFFASLTPWERIQPTNHGHQDDHARLHRTLDILGHTLALLEENHSEIDEDEDASVWVESYLHSNSAARAAKMPPKQK